MVNESGHARVAKVEPVMKTEASKTQLISDDQRQQYRQEGYMILKSIIPQDVLTMLREECSYFLGYKDAQMDAAGEKIQGISHRGKRYFIANRYRLSPRTWQFIFSPLMAQIAQAALGPNAYLFYDQWTIKGTKGGMKFGWHQDSGYVKYEEKVEHRPYLTCWCTLDDVSEANGTVAILPHSRGHTSDTIFGHEAEAGTTDLIGYKGDDAGITIVAPAGSIVAFSSYNFHRSGPNTLDRMRRIYVLQYCDEPIMTADRRLYGMAVPFVQDGKIVYSREGDTAEKYGPHLPK